MAGPGGSNEIIVKIVSQMKGDSKKVVDEVRKTAAAAEEVKTQEAAKGRKKRRAAEKSDSYQRTIEENRAYKQREANYRREMKQIGDKRKQEAAAWRAKESQEKKDRDRQIKYEEDIAKNAQKIREKAEREEAKSKAAARRREEMETRKAARKAESEQERARRKVERDRVQAAKKAERESPEYLQRAGYMGARARILRKQGAEAYLREQGIEPKAAKAKAVPLTYAQRRARAAAERDEYLTEAYGSPRAGRFALRQERAQTAVEAARDQQRIMFRRVLTGDTRRVGVSPTEMFKQGMAPNEQLESLRKVIDTNPVTWFLKNVVKYATAAITIPIGMGYARARQGVAMNRSFGRAQAELAGMEAGSDFRQYNIGSGRYSQAAAMGRSPQDLLRARVASLKGAGGGVSDIETLAFMVNAQMGAGDAAQMMSMSMMRGNKGKDIKKDINRTFAIGVAAGFKEIARQPIFAKSFAEYLSKGHVAGATREGAGSLLAAFTRAAPGGAISGLYGLDLIDKLQSGMAGPDPQSALAAFQRYLIGYGRPGSTMDFFQAEDIRAGGIHERPELVKNIKDTIRSVTRGSARQSRFMLRNVYGMTQPQAKEFLSVGDILPVPAGGEDKFRPETAAARTPPAARRYARQDLDLMRATVRATKSFDHFDDVMTELAATNEELISSIKDSVSDYLRKRHVTAQHEGAKKPQIPIETRQTANAEVMTKDLTAEIAGLNRYLNRDDLSSGEREAALQQKERAENRLKGARRVSAQRAVAKGISGAVGDPGLAAGIYARGAPSSDIAGKARGEFTHEGIVSTVSKTVTKLVPGLQILKNGAKKLQEASETIENFVDDMEMRNGLIDVFGEDVVDSFEQLGGKK